MVKFKEGDKIEMLDNCGEQLKGRTYIVKANKDGLLFVRADDTRVSVCNCLHKWKLIPSEILDWEKELKK